MKLSITLLIIVTIIQLSRCQDSVQLEKKPGMLHLDPNNRHDNIDKLQESPEQFNQKEDPSKMVKRSIKMMHPRHKSPSLLPKPIDGRLSNYRHEYDENEDDEEYENENENVNVNVNENENENENENVNENENENENEEENENNEEEEEENYLDAQGRAENNVIKQIQKGKSPKVKSQKRKSRKQKKKRRRGKKVFCQLLSRNTPDEKEYFFPDYLSKQLCSHVILDFGMLDPNTLMIKFANKDMAVIKETLRKALKFRRRGIKLLLSINLNERVAGERFGQLLTDTTARKKFAVNTANLLKEHRISGFLIDWDIPQCSGGCNVKAEYVNFLTNLQEEFKAKSLTLTIAVCPHVDTMDKVYDVKKLSAMLKYIVVKAYDYFFPNNKVTEHVAPFYKSASIPTYTVNATVHAYLKRGMPGYKMILGIPFHGIEYRLKDESNTNFGSPTIKDDVAKSKERGKIPYREICSDIKFDKWRKNSGKRAYGPYAFKGDLWVGFDNVKQVQRKANYAKKMKLLGVMVGNLEDDDFSNRCCCETFPLLKTVNRVVSNFPKTTKKCI